MGKKREEKIDEETFSRLMIEKNEVEIDKNMVPLIRELNNLGLRTTQCCSGHNKSLTYVSVSLENVQDVAIREKGKRLVIWWECRNIPVKKIENENL